MRLPRFFPAFQDLFDVSFNGRGRIDFHVILIKRMRLEVVKLFPRITVASHPFPAFYLGERRMHSDPEHIKWGKQPIQLVSPALLFNDMLDQQVQARAGEGTNRAMEAMEEGASVLKADIGVRRPKACLRQLVRSIVVEPRLKPWPKRLDQGRLA